VRKSAESARSARNAKRSCKGLSLNGGGGYLRTWDPDSKQRGIFKQCVAAATVCRQWPYPRHTLETPGQTFSLKRDHRLGCRPQRAANGGSSMPKATGAKPPKAGPRRFVCRAAPAADGKLARIAGLIGCGAGNGFLSQPPQDYTITITATSGTLQHTSTVTLNLQ
jgi:hypothetical protein